MLWMKKRFCDISPACYEISRRKEILMRHIRNGLSREKIARTKTSDKLPVILYASRANMIKRAPGVDLTTQFNKAENIRLACGRINGILIRPGESFSFWRTVGSITKRKGYREGRILIQNQLKTGLGGGLCNLSNTIHLAVIHAPLTVTEFHTHSDSLAPDQGQRIPLANGTSVSYNYIDFCFRNDTDQVFQLLTWCEGEELCCELRAREPIPYRYRLEERDRFFRKEGERFYHYSKIYRITLDSSGENVLREDLIWDNRSKVFYDDRLIPQELIAE